jgi:hypothetical protein
VTYFWPGGTPITVEVDPTGRPVRILWNGRHHAVDRVAGGWLVDDRWWIARVWRLYYLVTTHTGLLMVVFRNVLTNTWSLERLYD